MEKKLLDCEWMILRVLWKKPGLSMGEIIAGVQKENPEVQWKYKTYHSYLRVMTDKELIGSDVLNAKEKRYYALLSQEDALRMESDTVMQRISAHSLPRMMAMMAENSGLTGEDKEQLAALFDRLKKDGESIG